MEFIHFIPFVNEIELLAKAAQSTVYLSEQANGMAYIIDNRSDGSVKDPAEIIKELNLPFKIYTPDVPLTTAQVMNLMLKIAAKNNCEFFTWVHTDAEASDDLCKQFLERIRGAKDTKWGIYHTAYDAMAAYRVKAFLEIGGWDWIRFPYYMLDVDIMLRIVKAGYTVEETYFPVKHHVSSTIGADAVRALVTYMLNPVCQKLFDLKHKAND